MRTPYKETNALIMQASFIGNMLLVTFYSLTLMSLKILYNIHGHSINEI